tara:strand:+ start:594 stop:971 length:378 start_codon:yes stop_codon:yes gene_type:complete
MGRDKIRLGLGSFFTSKGTIRKQRGQPRLDLGIEFVIYGKLLQISKGRNISVWKAWHQLLLHKEFPYLMKPHFIKMKKYKNSNTWREKIKDPDWQNDFYKNNVIKSQLIKRFNEIDFTYIKNKTK